MPRTKTPSTRLLQLLSATLLCASSSSAQAPEDPGPHPVGVRDVSFSHPLSGNSTVGAVIYYPALSSGQNASPDTAAGPYPLVTFLHGWFAPPEWYSELSAHVASWGFVVAATQTESGLFQDITRQAKDSHALLHWVDAQGADPSSFFHALPGPGAWGAYGHSNGAAGSLELAGFEPRIEVLGLLEPRYYGVSAAVNANFQGDLLVIAGDFDLVNPPSLNAEKYFDEAAATARKSWFLIEGAGHNGALDFPVEIDPLGHGTQHRLHRRAVGGFLRAEFAGAESSYMWLHGAGTAGEPIDHDASCSDPPLWAASPPAPAGALAIGVAAQTGELALVAWSLAPAALPTPWGLLGLDLSQGGVLYSLTPGANGVVEQVLPSPGALAGTTIHLQALALAPSGSGALSAATSILLP